MKNMLLVFATLLITLSLLYVDTFVVHDTQTFVPSPESVTEDFFKMLETRRFTIATKFLSETTRKKTTVEELKRMDQQLRERIGEYNVYGGEARYASSADAMANVHLKGAFDENWPVLYLKKESGEWKIQEIRTKL